MRTLVAVAALPSRPAPRARTGAQTWNFPRTRPRQGVSAGASRPPRSHESFDRGRGPGQRHRGRREIDPDGLARVVRVVRPGAAGELDLPLLERGGARRVRRGGPLCRLTLDAGDLAAERAT